jgi:hypothetical protein
LDNLIQEFERFRDLTSAFTIADIAMVMGMSLVLSLAVTWTYRYTHRGTSYSQSFAQTLVLLGMIVALIMLLIGSNLARAFSLLGALSIIRFRNAIKEPRDVGFVFLVMAIGMACGTRFYALAAFAAVTLSSVSILMHKMDLFQKRVTEQILRVRLPAGRDLETTLDPVFRDQVGESRLIAVETVAGGAYQEAVYTVVLRPGADPQKLLEAIRFRNDNNKVALVMGQHEVDL